MCSLWSITQHGRDTVDPKRQRRFKSAAFAWSASAAQMIRFFTTHPTVANLLMIGFLVAGFAAVPKLQREIFTQI